MWPRVAQASPLVSLVILFALLPGTRASGSASEWERLTISRLYQATSAWDPVRQRLVLVGGSDGRMYNDEVLAMSSIGAWSKLADVSGRPRVGMSVIYDPPRDRFLVFGGWWHDYECLYSSATKVITLGPSPTMTPLQTQGTPPPERAYHLAAYDPKGDRMLVFGGKRDTSYCAWYDCMCVPRDQYEDVWQLTLTDPPTWSQMITQGTSPQAGLGSGCYDPVRQRLLVINGHDLWALDLADEPTWTALTWTGNAPSTGGEAEYDSAGDRVLYFDGTDTWSLSLGPQPDWQKLPRSGAAPNLGSGFNLVLDPDGQRLLACGGHLSIGQVGVPNDVWQLPLSGTGDWQRFDAASGTSGSALDARVAYDSRRHMALLFNANENRTFSLDLEGGRQWSPIDLGSSLPSGLVSPSLVYDLRRDRLVLVLDAAGRSWALEREHPSGWGQLPAIHPAPFNYGCAVYDPRRDRIWATGATGGAASDVWSVSLANPVAWDRVSTTGYRSSPLVLSTAFYDAARDRMIIMGGYGLADTGWLSEVWALDLETLAWAQLRADSDEPSGSGLLPGSIYDPVRNRMVATTGTDYYNTGSWFLWNADLWGPTTTAWNWEWPVCGYPDDFTAYCPVLRDLPLCLYDPWVDRIIVFGGYIGSLFPPVSLDDTWALTWGTPTAAQVSLVEASATPSTAHIVWQVTDRSGAVTVQRRAAGGGEWSARGTLVPDGQGRVAYHDADVVPGTRYGYRLILSGPDGPTFHAEVWIDVPVAAAAFAIAGVHPNPSRAGFRVELSLATAEPARIEVHDIAGRLLVGRDLTGLPAGAHVIELGEAARLPAGLYFVRLRQGRQVTSSTVALVR